MRPKPLVLVILDGWGVAPKSPYNAISEAKTPRIDGFIREYPSMVLSASGEAVGLPWGQAGNSEVGHLTIGAGYPPYQALPKINKAIADQSFFQNAAFQKAAAHVHKNKSRLHLIGLVSTGGVHSHIDHLYALLDFARRENIEEVYIHVILDGRDTPPASGAEFVAKLQEKIDEIGVGKIATVSGRQYAMDRDHRWDRVAVSYRAIVEAKSDIKASSAAEAINQSYEKKVYDEQLEPTIITSVMPNGAVKSNDAVIFFNFRPDRARELAMSLALEKFDAFKRQIVPKNLFIVTMATYEYDLPVTVAFVREVVTKPLAKILSEHKLKQLHIAETEKYAHVTYFLNGGTEEAFDLEDDVLIPSPPVVSYAETPEMSAKEISNRMIEAILSEKYDVIIVNFANADMVGHTGNLAATITSIETLDYCLGDVADAVLAKNGLLLITADHGNAEMMIQPQTGEIDKSHSTNPAPLIIVANQLHGKTAGLPDAAGGDLSHLAPAGTLADIAPTMLKILNIPIPKIMKGRPLL